MDKQFFVKKEINYILRSFFGNLKNVSVNELGESSWIVKPFLNIVDMMIEHANLFDKYSNVNIEWVGDDMIDRMRKFVNPVEGGRTGEIIIIFLLLIVFCASWSLWLPRVLLHMPNHQQF